MNSFVFEVLRRSFIWTEQEAFDEGKQGEGSAASALSDDHFIFQLLVIQD